MTDVALASRGMGKSGRYMKVNCDDAQSKKVVLTASFKSIKGKRVCKRKSLCFSSLILLFGLGVQLASAQSRCWTCYNCGETGIYGPPSPRF